MLSIKSLDKVSDNEVLELSVCSLASKVGSQDLGFTVLLLWGGRMTMAVGITREE